MQTRIIIKTLTMKMLEKTQNQVVEGQQPAVQQESSVPVKKKRIVLRKVKKQNQAGQMQSAPTTPELTIQIHPESEGIAPLRLEHPTGEKHEQTTADPTIKALLISERLAQNLQMQDLPIHDQTEEILAIPTSAEIADEYQRSQERFKSQAIIEPSLSTVRSSAAEINADIENIVLQVQQTLRNREKDTFQTIRQTVMHEKLTDPRIYNELIKATHCFEGSQSAISVFGHAEQIKAVDINSYNLAIQLHGIAKKRVEAQSLYDRIKKLANAQTYIDIIEALSKCGDATAAWNIYSQDVPQEIKNTCWKIHEAIMLMVLSFASDEIATTISMALKALDNTLNAKLNMDYDIVFATMLRIAFAYNLVEDFADQIYLESNSAIIAPNSRLLTNAAYMACKAKLETRATSEELTQMNMTRARQRSNRSKNANYINENIYRCPIIQNSSQATRPEVHEVSMHAARDQSQSFYNESLFRDGHLRLDELKGSSGIQSQIQPAAQFLRQRLQGCASQPSQQRSEPTVQHVQLPCYGQPFPQQPRYEQGFMPQPANMQPSLQSWQQPNPQLQPSRFGQFAQQSSNGQPFTSQPSNMQSGSLIFTTYKK